MSHHLADVTPDHEALIQFLYIAPVGLVQASADGEIAMMNPVSAQLLMPLAADADLTNLFTALHDVVPDLRHRVAAFEPAHGTICDALRIPLSRGTGPQVLSLTVLKLDQNRIMAMIGDVTQAVLRERLLQQNEAWLDAVLTGVTDYAVIRLDGAGRIHEWNPSIGHVTGFDAAVAGQPFSVFYPSSGTTPDRVMDRLREADEHGWSRDDGWRVRSDGQRFWASGMISPLRSPDRGSGQGASQWRDRQAVDGPRLDAPAYSLVIRDLSAQWEASEVERRATACDHLTGVANRRAFFAATDIEMTRSRRAGRRLSLAFFEVDDFDAVVERHGRTGGDAVLRQVAGLLASTFREVDVPARLGDARFAVLVPSTDAARATAVADRLRRSVLARPLVVESAEISYSLSGGIVTVDADSIDLQALMQLGAASLEAARAAGPNRIVAWPAPDRALA